MGKQYHNPWRSYVTPKWYTIFTARSRQTSEPIEGDQVRDINVVPVRFGGATTRPQLVWLGHASVYVLLPGADPIGILFDPIFSDRCSPVQWLGPKRRISPPCAVKDLPRVDYVVISHDHYDHLDKQSIRDIDRTHPGVVYVVPKGLGKWFIRVGIERPKVLELGWWEERQVGPAAHKRYDHGSKGSVDSPDLVEQIQAFTKAKGIFQEEDTRVEVLSRDTALRFICTPAQHNSGRGPLSRNTTLWASWVVEYLLPDTNEPFRIFFGGDTGFRSNRAGPACPVFKEIAEKYGPPDVSFLPLAAGSVLPFIEKLFRIKLDHAKLTSAIHCMPSDAVEIHQIMQSRLSVGIHWGTFTTPQHAIQTILELDAICIDRGVRRDGQASFKIVDVGKVL